MAYPTEFAQFIGKKMVLAHDHLVEIPPKSETVLILNFCMGKNTHERRDCFMDRLVVPIEELNLWNIQKAAAAIYRPSLLSLLAVTMQWRVDIGHAAPGCGRLADRLKHEWHTHLPTSPSLRCSPC